MKRIIVGGLEGLCTHVWDRLFVSTAIGAWLFHRVLRLPICWPAMLSFKLDEHWHTGFWKVPEQG